jgi:hypothetical protein
MSTRLIADILEAVARVRAAGSTRALRHGVNDFIRVLGSIPDEPAGTLSADQVHVIQSLGDNVIDRIEARVDTVASSTQTLPLVSAVYEIRRLLEEVRRWHLHYVMARPA